VLHNYLPDATPSVGRDQVALPVVLKLEFCNTALADRGSERKYAIIAKLYFVVNQATL